MLPEDEENKEGWQSKPSLREYMGVRVLSIFAGAGTCGSTEKALCALQ
jgi:hypothetical protein